MPLRSLRVYREALLIYCYYIVVHRLRPNARKSVPLLDLYWCTDTIYLLNSVIVLLLLKIYIYLCIMKRVINIMFNLKVTDMSKKKISTTLLKVIISVVISVLSAVGVIKSDIAGVVTTAVTSVSLPDSI